MKYLFNAQGNKVPNRPSLKCYKTKDEIIREALEWIDQYSTKYIWVDSPLLISNDPRVRVSGAEASFLDETDIDDWFITLTEYVNEKESNDPYRLAKAFEDSGWEGVNFGLVSQIALTLDVMDAIQDEKIRAWFAAYKPEPPFAIGADVRLAPHECIFTIVEICDNQMAQYSIKRKDGGQKWPEPVNFEDLLPLE